MTTRLSTLVLTFLLIIFFLCPSAIGSVDTDGDGLNDTDESIFGTDLDNPDEDEDGMDDGAELTLGLFLNPLSFRPDSEGISQLYFSSNQSSYYSFDWQPGNGQNGRATAAGFIPENYFLLDNMTGAETSLLSISNISILNSDVHTSEWVKGYDSVNSFIIDESPASFILPYDANDTPSIPVDDFYVPILTTEVSQTLKLSTVDTGLSDSQNSTTPSENLYLVKEELNTDFSVAMDGLTISRRLDPNWTLSIIFADYNASLAGRFLLGIDPDVLAGTGTYNNSQATAGTYGELLSGTAIDPNLGSVQMNYEKLFGQIEISEILSSNFRRLQPNDTDGDGFIDYLEEVDSSMINLMELEYRPNGDDSEIYRVTFRPAVDITFATENMVLSLSDQFRKMYYDTAQFGEFSSSTFGASYFSNGAITFRAPKFLNALLGTIDYPASQGDVPAQQAMEWFFNGISKDDSPTMIRDSNGYIRSLNLSGEYQATLSLNLSEQYFGLYESASVMELANDESNLSMKISLSNGDNPLLDWLVGVSVGGSFEISVTDENLFKNLFPFVRYDLLYDSYITDDATETAGAWNDISFVESQVAGTTELPGRTVSDILGDFGISASVSASSSAPSQSDISDAYSQITNNGLNGLSLTDILNGETTFNFSDYFTEAELIELINKLEEYPGVTIDASVHQSLLDEFATAFSVLPDDTSNGDLGSESEPPPSTGGGGGGSGCSIGDPTSMKAEIDLGIFLIFLIPVLIRAKYMRQNI